MPAGTQPERQGDGGMQIPERTEAGEDDAGHGGRVAGLKIGGEIRWIRKSVAGGCIPRAVRRA